LPIATSTLAMSTQIKILHVNAVRVLELRDELLDAGLVQDRDFTWSYHQAEYDNFSYDAVTPRHACFNFEDASLATFYQLKWLA
jgi:hypothetical protein